MGKRVTALFGAFALLFSVAVWRISYLGRNDTFTKAAAQQSHFLLEITNSRGVIYDSELNPLAGGDEQLLAAVVPGNSAAMALKDQFASTEEWQAALGVNSPFVMPVTKETFASEDIEVFSVPVRYGENFTAAHVIGYTDGDGGGVAGIERVYNDFLRKVGLKISLRYKVDAIGRAFSGGGAERIEEGSHQDGVVLTLNKRLQQACEGLLEDGSTKGAIVVMDVQNGDIKALASAPGYDPRNVASVIADQDGPLINRGFYSFAVGSSFKILVAAAALEKGIPAARSYSCEGYIDIDGQIFKCNNLAGHGALTMKEAMACSCNIYFIKLAEEIGAGALRDAAVEFGFSKSDLLAEGYQTATGNLPSESDLNNPAELANFGFGQGFLTATPIQLAKLVSAVANGGRLVSPRLVQGLYTGGVLEETEAYAQNTVLSEKTAARLREFMAEVVNTGSGVSATPFFGGAGGKTASAQTGVYDEEKNEIVHGWFCGYYPAENPQYAIVVLAENGQSGSKVAGPIFAKVANYLWAFGMAELAEEVE